MTEEKLNALRQADANLRDALKKDEAERQQMPADLNERLMQRMTTQEEKKSRRVIWPWIAAACVAGVMMIWLTPPKNTPTDVVAKHSVIEQSTIDNKVEETETAEAETEVKQPMSTPTKEKKVKVHDGVTKREPRFLAQDKPATQMPVSETPVTSTTDEVNDMAMAETAKLQEKPVTLSERDIPITRPENYKYTPEELALMKKQANEAYLKWVELELEISKYNLEQTAQK